MNPKHYNPSIRFDDSRKNRWSTAPYNFVPLPEGIAEIEAPPAQDKYQLGTLSGVLICLLRNESAMYVRAAQTLEEYDANARPSHPSYGSAKTELTLPGSSLRGMLRSMVEIVSHARILPVTDKPVFFRTVDPTSVGKAYGKRMSGGNPNDKGYFPLASAGYIGRQGSRFFIRPAKTIKNTQYYRVEEEIARPHFSKLRNMATQKEDGRWSPNKSYHWLREKIWFQPVAPSSHPDSPAFFAAVSQIATGRRPSGEGWEEGWFIASGWVPSRGGRRGKHRHWIIGPAEESDDNLIWLEDEDVDLYREYGGGISQKIRDEGLSVLPAGPDETIPCFYAFWEDAAGTRRVAFGHTAMFRLPYRHSAADMVPAALRKASGFDLAEALFGTVDTVQGGRGAVAGRVFITDGKHLGDGAAALLESGPVTLSSQAMSGPKPTAIQHYLTQTYPDEKDFLNHYDHSPDDTNPHVATTIRGHKLYWHRKDDLSAAMRPRESERREEWNVFHPVKPGQDFEFRIHFENLRPQELGALLWVLDKAADENYRLKIGMGKAYGLGSVQVRTTETKLIDRAARYKTLFSVDPNGLAWNEGTITGEEAAKRLSQARTAFTEWLLNQPIHPEKTEKIDDLPRIRQLLALLAWPGPPNKSTRYQALEEFKSRPVLPMPLNARENTPGQHRPVPVDHPNRENLPEQTSKTISFSTPEGDYDNTGKIITGILNQPIIPGIEIGASLIGDVDDIYDDGTVFLYFEGLPDNVLGRIKLEWLGDMEVDFGDSLTCIVLAVVEERDLTYLDCRPA